MKSSRTMLASLLYSIARLLVDLLTFAIASRLNSKLKFWPRGMSGWHMHPHVRGRSRNPGQGEVL